jgi:hypothetical protein
MEGPSPFVEVRQQQAMSRSARHFRDIGNASLAKSVASKFRGNTVVERLRRREIGAASLRIILTPQAGETAPVER